jgi:hypothetical protein
MVALVGLDQHLPSGSAQSLELPEHKLASRRWAFQSASGHAKLGGVSVNGLGGSRDGTKPILSISIQFPKFRILVVVVTRQLQYALRLYGIGYNTNLKRREEKKGNTVPTLQSSYAQIGP